MLSIFTFPPVVSTIDQLRRPEYTGANRCLPCTIVNVLLAAAGTLAVATVWPWVGLALFVVALGSIYFRGYLVPGTPELTKRYLPRRVLRLFDKDPRARRAVTSDDTTLTVDVEGVLRDAGAIVDTGEDIALQAEFERAWQARMHRFAAADPSEDRIVLGCLFDVDADRIVRSPRTDAYVVYVGHQQLARWESRAAFIADVAADEELGERYDGWDELPLTVRSEVLGGLRACIEHCPVCTGDVTLGQAVVESCCQSFDVVAATCDACGARLFEVPYDPELFDAESA